MIGPVPCACAYVDPVFTSQSYDITQVERTCLFFLCLCLLMSPPVFSLAYTCACASGIVCLCSCLRGSENQAQ